MILGAGQALVHLDGDRDECPVREFAQLPQERERTQGQGDVGRLEQWPPGIAPTRTPGARSQDGLRLAPAGAGGLVGDPEPGPALGDLVPRPRIVTTIHAASVGTGRREPRIGQAPAIRATGPRHAGARSPRPT